MTFEVWAPRATTVTLEIAGIRHAMAEADGWWRSDAPATGDYGYLLDDDETVLPDPRSRWQPHGVHGLSRPFEPAQAWSPWAGRELAGGVIYELHVGTFTPGGTLDSAVERLDHLVDLGIDFVELLPVNAFNGEHNWGYDGVLWYAVQHSYGGPAAYLRFVDACHVRGLGVIQDVVYNHLGPSGNYLPRFGPYLRDTEATTWGASLNLDGDDSRPVRDYIIENALMWLGEYHVDGLRLDAVHALVDSSDEHLLRELAGRVEELSRERGIPLSLIAESDLNDPVMITREGHGLTAQWDDDYHHAVHVALTGETSGYYADFEGLGALAKVMTRGFFHDGVYSSFRGRTHGLPIDTAVTETWRLIAYSQDHDQVGNRAAGDRLPATLTPGQLELAAALTVLTPFTPMIFMGEEWGASTPWQFFTSHPEPELGRATAEGRIAEFARMGWDAEAVPDPQHPATFHRSKLNWSELSEPAHARLFEVYRELIRLRRENPGLSDPSFETIECEWDSAAGWLRLTRPGVSVLFDFANPGFTVTSTPPAAAGREPTVES